MADNCRETWITLILPGEFQIGKSQHEKNTSDTYEAYTMQKAYLAVLAISAPSQIFVWGPIHFRLKYMTRTDTKGHP